VPFYSDKASIFRETRQSTDFSRTLAQFGRALFELYVDIHRAPAATGTRWAAGLANGDLQGAQDLTTVGVCVACATPPVDVSTEVLASARRRHFYLAGDAT